MDGSNDEIICFIETGNNCDKSDCNAGMAVLIGSHNSICGVFECHGRHREAEIRSWHHVPRCRSQCVTVGVGLDAV